MVAGIAALVLAQVSRSAAADESREPPVTVPASHRHDRFEIREIVGWGSSPSTSSHWLVGGGVYFHAPYLSFGFDAVLFDLFNDDSAAAMSRASYPAYESSWAATASVALSPFRHHVRDDGADRTLMPYVLGGFGVISTRPLSLVLPTLRVFDYKPTATFDAGLGVHSLFSRAVGIDIEIRDTIFEAQFEATTDDSGPVSKYAPSGPLTNFIALQIGASLFAGGR